MNLNIYFKEDEVIAFLNRNGYSVEKINCFEDISIYHNDVETKYSEVIIAYNEDEEHPYPNNIKTPIDITSVILDEYEIENVFNEVIKLKLLEL